uniref:SKI/SNO/DAC domain-containing protein n=1 Tax=Romanomermis culicivorax TaxID=13658 RepID=A0A915KK12_ROMCU
MIDAAVQLSASATLLKIRKSIAVFVESLGMVVIKSLLRIFSHSRVRTMDKESSATKNMIPTNDNSQIQRFAYFGNSLYPFHFGMAPGNNGRPANSDASPINDKRTDDSASPEPCFRLEYLPEAAEAKLVDYRGQKMAAFVVDGETMICLPQAYEIFLKHLVGGLHTVYTKLKRLEITPFVCNVEQVRALRSIGAIQPGVNRCKLIACRDFDILHDDCASSK